MSDYTRGEENKTQYKQGLVIKAAILITKMLNKLDIFRKDNENFPTDIIELGTDALGLLGHFNRLANLSRRDLHRPDLSNEYFHLCSSSVPYTNLIYGDDISKKVSDIDSVNKIGKRVGSGRGFGYGRYPRRYGRAGFRHSLRGGRSRGSTRGRDTGGYNNQDYNGRQDNQNYSSSKNFRRGLRRRRP